MSRELNDFLTGHIFNSERKIFINKKTGEKVECKQNPNSTEDELNQLKSLKQTINDRMDKLIRELDK